MNGRVFSIIARLSLVAGPQGDGLHPLRDLDSVRSFLASAGPIALFDLPWLPLYLVVIFSFHPLLGMTALVGAVVLIVLTALTEILTREPISSLTKVSGSRTAAADAARRNAEVIAAMGMGRHLGNEWKEINAAYIDRHRAVSDITSGFGATSKILRMTLQSAMLGLGAYLVIYQQATAGIIIAGSILASRALAPVDQAIAYWKGFVSARQSWGRLAKLLDLVPAAGSPMSLPLPGLGSYGRESERCCAGHAQGCGARRQVPAGGRQCAHDRRPERLRQIKLGAYSRRRVATSRGACPARRRRPYAMGTRRIRSSHRVFATGRRAVRGHGGAEHRAL